MKKLPVKISAVLAAIVLPFTVLLGCNPEAEGESVKLSFYAVNDLHGRFMDTDSQPGLDEFTTYMKGLYADKEREEILLATGDMWQGTVESSGSRGQLMTEWMNKVGFSSMTLGNHEYDWGANGLEYNSRLAEFPFLAINVTYNGSPVSYCRDSQVIETRGVKIGIIGAIGDCLSSISGEFTQGLNFATGAKLTELVKGESVRLRKEEGCDFIVYSIHDGGTGFSPSGINNVKKNDVSDYYDTALSDGYVDLVFEGHTHQRYILKDEYGVYHLQGGAENGYISCAEVSVNRQTKKHTVKPSLINKSVYASSKIDGDPVVDELFNKYLKGDNPYTTVLGTTKVKRRSGEICDLVAKLYYEEGVSKFDGRYDIVLGGGYLKTRNPYDISAGKITYSDLYSLFPFDNDLVLGSIKGSDLKSRFLNTDNSNYHSYSKIKSAEVNDGDYYYIIVDTYSSTYAPNRITEVKRLATTARELLADFVSAGGWER